MLRHRMFRRKIFMHWDFYVPGLRSAGTFLYLDFYARELLDARLFSTRGETAFFLIFFFQKKVLIFFLGFIFCVI